MSGVAVGGIFGAEMDAGVFYDFGFAHFWVDVFIVIIHSAEHNIDVSVAVGGRN